MAIIKYKGKTKTEWLPVAVSQAFTKNTIVEFGSGTVNPADDNDTDLAGVIIKAIASTDSDYATARKVPVLVPVERHVIWEADGTGTFAATDVGSEFGISDSGTVDKSDTTNKVFKVTEFLSASKVRGYLKINGSY